VGSDLNLGPIAYGVWVLHNCVGVKCSIKIYVVVADSSLWPTVLPAGRDKSQFVRLDIYSADCNSTMVAVSCGTLCQVYLSESVLIRTPNRYSRWPGTAFVVQLHLNSRLLHIARGI
jgi:hypothetical protein